MAQLTGEARHHARWRPLTEAEEAAAAAELRALADGRGDVLAEVAGIFEGTSEGDPGEPLARCAARPCRLAGADESLIPQWVRRGGAGRRSPGCRRMAEDTCNGATPSPVDELAGFCISTAPRGTTPGMKGQQHDGTADEFAAQAHKPLAQDDDQDTAAAWAAVAAWAITETDPDRRAIPAPGIVPPGVPRPRLPGVGPLPGP